MSSSSWLKIQKAWRLVDLDTHILFPWIILSSCGLSRPAASNVMLLWIISITSFPTLRISPHRTLCHVWLHLPSSCHSGRNSPAECEEREAASREGQPVTGPERVFEYKEDGNLRTVTRFLFVPGCHLLSLYSLPSICVWAVCVCVCLWTHACVSPRRLPLRGIAMKDPKVPPMTLCGRRSGGFLKEPVYWCRKECMLWEVGGRPFLMKGSEKTTTAIIPGPQKIRCSTDASQIFKKPHEVQTQSNIKPLLGAVCSSLETQAVWPSFV